MNKLLQTYIENVTIVKRKWNEERRMKILIIIIIYNNSYQILNLIFDNWKYLHFSIVSKIVLKGKEIKKINKNFLTLLFVYNFLIIWFINILIYILREVAQSAGCLCCIRREGMKQISTISRFKLKLHMLWINLHWLSLERVKMQFSKKIRNCNLKFTYFKIKFVNQN